jgi:3-dehydroquinate synthase
VREIPLLSSRLYVGPGARGETGRVLRALLPDARRAFLLTDKNCVRYARDVQASLQAADLEVEVHALPAGELQKKLSTAGQLYGVLARRNFDRTSVLVAVGGGVITDLGGFVASTYMRGLPLFLVPTTLLGQVDAAIGGKTAVNLTQGKNLVGTFHQPRAVLLDPQVLATLPAREYVSGLGEVAKYVIIRDAELGATIERNIEAIRKREPAVLEEIVHRCAAIKAEIVSQDERESGLRAILNYGHTIGHALEAAGNYRTLHHGEAISIGMEAEAILSMELGIAPLEVLAAQNKLLKLCGLPTRVRKMSQRKVLAAMKLDKKGIDGRLRFVLPEAVGKVRWPVEVPASLISAALRTVTA